MKAARRNARELRDVEPPSQVLDSKAIRSRSAETLNSQNLQATQGTGARAFNNLVSSDHEYSVEKNLPPLSRISAKEQKSNQEKSKRDIYSAARAQHPSDLRQGAMAYWRKNTNAERPGDAHFYRDLTSPAGYSWQNPFLANASNSSRDTNLNQRKPGLPGSDLTSLSAYITSNSKNYLSGMYAQKSQTELPGQEFDRYALPEGSHDDSSPTDISSYPHYQGEWQPLMPYNDFAVSIDATRVQSASEQLISSAYESEDDYLKELDTNHAWTTPTTGPSSMQHDGQIVSDELTESLKSIESSPQCDLLFEQSAAAAGAIFKGAMPMKQMNVPATFATPGQHLETMRLMESINDDAFEQHGREGIFDSSDVRKPSSSIGSSTDSQEEQSTTLDNLPEQQLVDVRISAADSAETAPEILRALAYDINPDVRFAIAENHNVDTKVLAILIEDSNPYVAHRARKTLQRLQGGQLKQGNFNQTQNPEWLTDRRTANP